MDVSCQTHAPATFICGKEVSGNHWTRDWGGTQSWSGLGGEEKRSLCRILTMVCSRK